MSQYRRRIVRRGSGGDPGDAGDPYRDALRAMTAVDHFGTDYRPVDRVGPDCSDQSDRSDQYGQRSAASDRCLCDAEPGVFTVFAFAVLALHQPRHTRSPRPTCACGLPADTCPVRALAEGLLFSPHPAPEVP